MLAGSADTNADRNEQTSDNSPIRADGAGAQSPTKNFDLFDSMMDATVHTNLFSTPGYGLVDRIHHACRMPPL